MLIQLVHIEVAEGKEDDFLKAFKINYEGTIQEPGNLRFDVLKNAGCERRYTIYEVFRDDAALEAHRQTEHYAKCVEILDPIMIGKREKTYFSPVYAAFLP